MQFCSAVKHTGWPCICALDNAVCRRQSCDYLFTGIVYHLMSEREPQASSFEAVLTVNKYLMFPIVARAVYRLVAMHCAREPSSGI